eukprot:528566-Rhodomonas_salina.2
MDARDRRVPEGQGLCSVCMTSVDLAAHAQVAFDHADVAFDHADVAFDHADVAFDQDQPRRSAGRLVHQPSRRLCLPACGRLRCLLPRRPLAPARIAP